MRFSTLSEWLCWQEALHPVGIDLGLERPGRVLASMGLRHPSHLVITVAGTNGKGSSVALLESILLAAGYRVGCYSSPHLLRYNERIRINGETVSDALL
ncbi:MAG: bifunctional folylpolyglutamate synthase/dihydrofolate synthase, partial [Gammaproteobacteria bacterium]|nr:bifunctional folylpolyglutamate synthase/dihydrofolate synthase [Gammaproteobacteria bacterium]